MDALMPALVAGLLLGVGDRTSWLAAMLADRSGKPFRILAAAALAFAAGNAAAAQASLLLPLMSPNASALLLAIALGVAAIGAFWPAARPTSFAAWPAFLGLFVLGFGEGMQFVTCALANRAPVPAFAAIGATLGTLAALAPAVALGEAAWLKLPLQPIRIASGAILLLVALILAAGALRLT